MTRERVLRASDMLATACALLVIPVIAIEMRATDLRWLSAAVIANWAIWLVFLFDAAANLYARGMAWLRRRSAWLDVVVIVASFPVLPALLASARLVRLARLGRVARAARPTRMLRAVRLTRLSVLVTRAFSGLRRVLDPAAFPFVAMAVALTVVTGAIAFYISDNATQGISLPEALWWAITTVTTVGYGDVVPRTLPGRTIAVIVMVVGIAFTSLLTANLAAHVASRRQSDDRDDLRAELRELAGKIDRLADEVRQAQRPGAALPDSAQAPSERAAPEP